MNMQRMQQRQRWVSKALVCLLAFSFVFSLWVTSQSGVPAAYAATAQPAQVSGQGPAFTPFMGWSTWNFIGKHPTEANIEAQAQAESSKLKTYGYNYVLLDDFWYLNPSTTVDANGYWVVDTSKFPNGLSGLASYVHSLGLKFGAYLTPGIPVAAVTQNTPIKGTSYTAAQIANTSVFEKNYNYGSSVMYAINYSAPGAQEYINGWADELASWGVDFLKMDGIGDSDIADLHPWSVALQQSGRPIYFDLSNNLDIANAGTWRANSNAWRTQGDVECYSSCTGQLVNWSKVSSRFNSVASWAQYAGPGGWNDLDAMDVADGTLDGLTNVQRQSTMSLWALAAAPMYMGDDLTQMDSYGLSLLSNTEVIAVDQSGLSATRVYNANNLQIWEKPDRDGSYSVGLFNLGSASASITVNWSQLGFSGAAAVRDLWAHSNLGSFSSSYTASSVLADGSVLLKVSPPISGTSYEAEASANTLAGGASVGSCSGCSGGSKVRYIGKGGSLQFNNISASSAGVYTMQVAYVDGDVGRSATISVNGGAATSYAFTGTNDGNWNIPQILVVSLTLNAGNNTILFANTSAYGPDLDRVVISATSSYEAEASANTLAGGAKVTGCSNCSGGQKVGALGKGGTLQFNNINASSAGTYYLQIAYVDGDGGRTATLSVNGGAATSLIFSGTADSNWNNVQVLVIAVHLNAGNNTLLFANASAYGPDLDRVIVS